MVRIIRQWWQWMRVHMGSLPVLVWINLLLSLFVVVGQFVLDLYLPTISLEPILSFQPYPIYFRLSPWGLITYMFINTNLTALCSIWVLEIVGRRLRRTPLYSSLLDLYLLGGIFGALLYMAVSNILSGSLIGLPLMGSSASVMAIISALAFQRESLAFSLLGFRLRLPFGLLLGLILLLDITLLAFGDNWGGHIAHLGGAIAGSSYAYLWGRIEDLKRKREERERRLLEQVRFSGLQSLSLDEREELTQLHKRK